MSSTKTVRKPKTNPACCGSAIVPGARPLLAPSQAVELMALFKVLANDTRLRMLHALVCHGEMCVTRLADVLGMKPQAVSNQLQRLLDRRILGSRRQGTNVYYRIVNPCVTDLLDRGLCLVEDRCHES
ncbi:MAG TPA: metalloregulator ArsR/SmtB family transcription factor [Gemmataceae bacterium]|nr:metalloregulator ArsR/SmtB family transcription factor [Gemmataceae bacterium]